MFNQINCHVEIKGRIMCMCFGSISQLETRPLIGSLARTTNQRPIFQLTYASKTLEHDPALTLSVYDRDGCTNLSFGFNYYINEIKSI